MENNIPKPTIIKNASSNKNTTYDYLFKISLIGDSGIGKTSILLRFTDNVFKDDTHSTIGVDFKIMSVNIGNSFIKMQIWDTCGSERFKSLTSSFVKSCNIFLLIFDITKHKSFVNLENWIKTIYENTSPKFMCLVGNKIDLEQHRQVTREEALKFADKYNMNYIETSAKTNEKIEEIFLFVTQNLFNSLQQKRKNSSDGVGCEFREGNAFSIGGNKEIKIETPLKEEERGVCNC